MHSAPVSRLNQQTREVLDLVRSGEVVEITDRGVPVARIVPVGPTVPDDLFPLVSRGLVRPAREPWVRPPTDGPSDPQSRASEALAGLRADEDR